MRAPCGDVMDSFDQPWWNYHQVRSWVFSRNARLVRLMADKRPPQTNVYTLEGSPEADAHLLNPPEEDPTPLDFVAMSLRPGGEFQSNDEADWAIHKALQADRLGCWGRRGQQGLLERIPAPEWADLQMNINDDSEAVPTITNDEAPRSSIQIPRWDGLRFKSDEVLGIWPADHVAGDAEPAPEPVVIDAVPVPAESTAVARPCRKRSANELLDIVV